MPFETPEQPTGDAVPKRFIASADATRASVEAAARASYGRLVAYLATRSRDVAGAEDAVGGAFLAAMETWPRDGIPAAPEAWLMAVARRRLVDAARHARVRDAAADALRRLARPARGGGPPASDPFPDERLKLLFTCAHPAIDPGVRTPLMLQAVLGLDAARIARAFLVAPATMGQRLSRAKAKIRDAGIAFDVPEPPAWPARLANVLAAVYAAYGTGWDDAFAGEGGHRNGLADEAIGLARLLVELMPAEPEPLGLLALALHCEARRPARRSATGAFVPLSDQNPRAWSAPMIAEAERALSAASAFARPGRYQLEAAIQSAHAARAWRGRTDWRAVASLYDGLVAIAPTAGTLVGRATAAAEHAGPARGLQLLDAIDPDLVRTYQPYWAARGHALARLARPADAADALDRAIGLTADDAVRAFLLAKRAGLARQ